MTGCSAENCYNSGAKGFVLCRFPRDDRLREAWKKATGRQNWIPKCSNSLCEDHFVYTDWLKYRGFLKPGTIPTVFCDCQETENSPQPSDSLVLEHNYGVPKRRVLGEVNRDTEHNYPSRRAADQSKRAKKRVKTHKADCSVVLNKNAISRILGSKSPLSQEEAVSPPQKVAVSPPQEEVVPPPQEKVVSPPQEEVLSPPQEEVVSPPQEEVVSPPQEEVVSPPQEEVVSPSEQEDASLPQDVLLEKLEEKVADNKRLEKKVKMLERQVAAIKRQREELKLAKRELLQSKKREETVTKEHKELTEWLHGKFSQRQIRAATEGISRGSRWDEKDVKTALRLKCAGGTSGLKAASELLMPLPSPRTLRRKTAHLKFEPGVQHDILDEFAKYITESKEIFSDCLLYFDDMAIKVGTQFDKGSDHYIGSVTLPGVSGLACKTQAFMFGGLAKKWKFVAAYHFVPAEAHPQATKLVVEELLHKARSIGLNVLGIVCDMGNRGLLKAFGFSTLKDNIVYAIPNPADPTKLLYCIPDMVHVFKSVKEMFSNNSEIVLPQNLVELCELSSPKVQVRHVEKLCEYQDKMEIKLHPKLSIDDVHSRHFNKMKVAPSTHVFSDKTARALQLLVVSKEVPTEFETTAWFCGLLKRWFTIVTSRTRKLALSHHNMDAYNEAIEILRLVIYVFKEMRVSGGWKPCQTHIIMATSAVLDLQAYLLTHRKYQFVMLGRFLQDVVENLFSLIRMSRPNPTALELKYRLREIVISQFSQLVPNSSYSQDDRVDILENLLQPKESAQPELTATQQFGWLEPPETFLTEIEENSLYRMCGYVVKTLIDSKQIKCNGCLKSLTSAERHPFSFWTLLTNFKEGAQVEVSHEVYRLLKFLEYNLQRWKPLLRNLKTSFTEALERPLQEIPSNLPTCHGVAYIVLKRYSTMRLKQFTTNAKPAPSRGSHFGSRSMGSRFLADRFVR